MKAAVTALPKKTRELQNHHMDSTVWNEFEYRDGDVVIGTWAKAGTTWVQQIVAQLIFDGREDISGHVLSPWLDLRVIPREEKLDMLAAQDHRRIIKTHLPVDALPFSEKAKYIYVGRDGRDIVWSLYNHHAGFTEMMYDAFNNTPGRIGPPLEPPTDDIRQYFHDWLDGDGYPFWPFFPNIRSWWNIRDLPNVMLVHFNNLKADLEGEIRRIADFLEIAPSADAWPKIVEHSTFAHMKSHADQVSPMAKQAFKDGADTFIHKGTNSRWRDVLNDDDIRKYEKAVARNLTPDCAHWLATGDLPES